MAKDKMTQKTRIWNYLVENGSITPLDALREFGVMKILVEVPDEEYDSYALAITFGMGNTAIRRILNGTPLPKGHGRLIDADALWESLKEYGYSDGFCIEHNIDCSINLGMAGIVIGDAPTIIEADTEGAEE